MTIARSITRGIIRGPTKGITDKFATLQTTAWASSPIGSIVSLDPPVAYNRWAALDNATTENNSGASWATYGGHPNSNGLYFDNFGFAIPSGAEILGIEARIVRRYVTSGGDPLITDTLIKLLDGGTKAGDSKPAIPAWVLNTWTETTFGADNDLWGVAWTPSKINAATFGIVFECTSGAPGTGRNAEVDVAQLRITYFG